MVAERGEGAGEDVEALVLFEAADAEENGVVIPDPVPGANRHPLRLGGKRVDFPKVECVRDHTHTFGGEPEVRAHDGLEAAVGRDDAVGGAGACEYRAAQRQIGGALPSHPGGIRTAELLEALRVEHERRGAACAAAGESEHAGAEPVHEVDDAEAARSHATRPARSPNHG